MEINFYPQDSLVDIYTSARFYFKEGLPQYWGDVDIWGEVAEQYEHHDLEDMKRVNLEYGSPLIDGYFPEKGYFISQSVAIDDDAENNVAINRVFIPVGCTRVELAARMLEEVVRCVIRITEDSVDEKLCHLLTFSSAQDTTLSPEVARHQYNRLESINNFDFKPHELQINGSDLFPRFNDYLTVGRSNYIEGYGRSVPEFVNFSLSRTFSKFYIGAPLLHDEEV